MCTKGNKSYRAEGAPNLGASGSMLPQQKILKLGVSEMPSPAFSAGHFQSGKDKGKCNNYSLFYQSISSVIGN